MSPAQGRELKSAEELHERGLYYIPRDIAGHSACAALVRRGVLFTKPGVRHEETGFEVLGYGIVGRTYPDTEPNSVR